ncbi:hypothetical protein B0H10DRAFT_2011526 [Mycena sp. CBHHK59/15]|nr:hypothetical protein B0H10DRAFT_2011526 [Mycena sp. CBHHK59/15]
MVFGFSWPLPSSNTTDPLPYYNEGGQLIGRILPPRQRQNTHLPYYDDEGHRIGTIVSATPKKDNKVPVRHYDQDGNLIGTVRLEPSPLLRISSMPAPSDSFAAQTAVSNSKLNSVTKLHARGEIAPISLTPNTRQDSPDSTVNEMLSPVASQWDGWPNCSFVCFFGQQQVQSTNMLEVQWTSEALGPRKGSVSAATWQRGKLMQRRCRGGVECYNEFCGLAERCLCGAILRHRDCGASWSIHLFLEGARFQHMGIHSHPPFTHTLAAVSKDRPRFAPVKFDRGAGDPASLRRVRFQAPDMLIDSHHFNVTVDNSHHLDEEHSDHSADSGSSNTSFGGPSDLTIGGDSGGEAEREEMEGDPDADADEEC